MKNKITIADIKETLEKSKQKSWDINGPNTCPLAKTGKRLFGRAFEMYDHYSANGSFADTIFPKKFCKFTGKESEGKYGKVLVKTEVLLAQIEKMTRERKG